MTTGKKITRATFKAFIRKNRSALHVKVRSRFDGMTDGCETVRGAVFEPATDAHLSRMPIVTRNWFEEFEADGFRGIRMDNCCGSFVVAVPAEVSR